MLIQRFCNLSLRRLAKSCHGAIVQTQCSNDFRARLFDTNPPRRLFSSDSSTVDFEPKGLWDDSGWMNHGDSNAEAYETLDITKLKPFPEFRNVVTGPVWPADAFELLWKKYYDEQTPQYYAKKHNEEWDEFIADNGFSPDEYFNSEEYKERYEQRLVWADFRRNHKGSRQRQKTRRLCLVTNKNKGNPCPLCRDKHLLINFRNLILLRHFIDPHSGKVHHSLRTGVCRIKQKSLEHTIWLARDQGLLPTPVPNHEPIDPNDYKVNYLAVRPFS